MNRLTQRISTMWSAVKCPRCGRLVQPDTLLPEEGAPPPAADDEKRWSFLWTPPRGDVCPECDFPLSKYFGRLKWIRTFVIGVAIVLLSVALQLIGLGIRPGTRFVQFTMAGVLIGAAVAIIGALGVIIGGKHATVRVGDKAR